jgi:hypothetical protein
VHFWGFVGVLPNFKLSPHDILYENRTLVLGSLKKQRLSDFFMIYTTEILLCYWLIRSNRRLTFITHLSQSRLLQK